MLVVGASGGVGGFVVPVVLDPVPVGAAAFAAVADGGTLLSTRPTEPLTPDRGVRQELVLVELDRAALAARVAELADGRLRTRVADILPLSQAARAHRLAEAGGLRGKLILRPGS